MKILLICLIASLFALPLHAQTSSGTLQGVSSDGRDFYIGMVPPSYNSVESPQARAFFGAFVLVMSYTDNIVRVSYFDKATGIENPAVSYHIPARTGIQIPLDASSTYMNPHGDTVDFAACHITAITPINVEYFSTGACAGGSYLALATPSLGRKYVIASYDNNPGNLGLIGEYLGPKSVEVSHGFFLITAPFDNTKVTITPNSTTMGGHKGLSSGLGAIGAPFPYTVFLKRGQCYLVKSASDDSQDDISASVVESDKPIAVLGGHENAALGGVSNRNLEGRDYMVEQMIPVDFWDTTGYVSIPLVDSQPQNPDLFEGTGENYRTYAYELSTNIAMYDECVSGHNDMNTSRFAYPVPERFGETCTVDFEATNGKKFSVMMYDNRNFANSAPYPAPSMMTIIPMSHWKTSYAWYVPANVFEILQEYYINVIGLTTDFSQVGGILASRNGGSVGPIGAVLSLYKKYKGSIPNHPELTGETFRLAPGSYYATGPNPFIVYNFGFRAIDANYDLGDFDGDDFFFSYANPTGASLSSGDTANFKMTVDSLCGKWNLCIRDQRKSDPGIRSVLLLNDSLGIQYSPGRQFANCYLDSTFDLNNFGEVELDGTVSLVCFGVHIRNALLPAYAPVLVTDNAGNELVVNLQYVPPQLGVSPSSFALNLNDIFLGHDSCAFVTVKNTDSISHAISATNWSVGKNFVISSIQPPLPVTLKHNDSLKIGICLLRNDTARVSDVLNFNLDCLPVQFSVSGNGATGLIYASDKNFGRVFADSGNCDTVGIYNVGKYPITITGASITGSPAFSFRYTGLFPFILNPGQKKLLTICYTPSAAVTDTAFIHWTTDIRAPYTESIKSFSTITGERATAISWDKKNLGLSVVCIDSETIRIHIINISKFIERVDSIYINGLNSPEWIIVGDELGYLPVPKFNLIPGDTIWIDVMFKPDLNKPQPAKYADRIAQLVAIVSNESNQIINLTGHVLYAAPVVAPGSLNAIFKVVGLGGTSTPQFLIADTGTAPLVIESISPLTYPIFSISGISVGDSIYPGQLSARNVSVEFGFNYPLLNDTTIFLTLTFKSSCAGNIVIPIHIKPASSNVQITNKEIVILFIRPNPAKGNSIIISLGDTPVENAELKIFDVLGRELITRNITGKNEIEIPIRSLQNGIYYAQVTIGGKVLMEKFEVMR